MKLIVSIVLVVAYVAAATGYALEAFEAWKHGR
jgi:hypothetical protein